MSRTNDQSTELPHHEPTDSDIAEAMRDRRVELGLTVEESAERAGVSTQTWRNYEHGRTTVRGDKQHGVWDVLGWEQPGRWAPLSALERVVEPAGGPLDDDVMESFRNLWGDEPADGATKTLGPPAWDSVPDVLGAYSPLLATTLGEGAARCYALGADLYGRLLEEDLGALAAMPRDAHIGQLDVSHMSEMLPSLWLTRYDYEFLFQLKEIGAVTTHRLVGAEPAPDEPLVRSFAEAIVVHDAFALGGVVASSLGVDLAERDWEGWVNALSGPAEPAHRLTSTVLIPSADEMIHIDHWFDPLTDPFVPAWRSVDDVPSAGGPEAGATVTALHHEDWAIRDGRPHCARGGSTTGSSPAAARGSEHPGRGGVRVRLRDERPACRACPRGTGRLSVRRRLAASPCAGGARPWYGRNRPLGTPRSAPAHRAPSSRGARPTPPPSGDPRTRPPPRGGLSISERAPPHAIPSPDPARSRRSRRR